MEKLLAFVFAASVLLFSGGNCRAEMTACNHTQYAFATAFGLLSEDSIWSFGWFEIEPEKCASIWQGSLVGKYRSIFTYVLVQSPESGSPLALFSGATYFCVKDDPFLFDGKDSCIKNKGQSKGFYGIEIDDSENIILDFVQSDSDDDSPKFENGRYELPTKISLLESDKPPPALGINCGGATTCNTAKFGPHGNLEFFPIWSGVGDLPCEEGFCPGSGGGIGIWNEKAPSKLGYIQN